MIKISKTKGFTLAETLITLAIIGVVAALTLPSLIQNYHKKQWVAGLKSGISIFSQGFKKILADEEVDSLANTELFKTCNTRTELDDATTNACFSILKKYFKTIKIESHRQLKAMDHLDDDENSYDYFLYDSAKCKAYLGKTRWWTLYNEGRVCIAWHGLSYTLANGMTVRFNMIDPGDIEETGEIQLGNIWLDVNGQRGPNVMGRDFFYLSILADGTVVPFWGYKYNSELEKEYNKIDLTLTLGIEGLTIADVLGYCAKPEEGETNDWNGYTCASRIERDGWEMKY